MYGQMTLHKNLQQDLQKEENRLDTMKSITLSLFTLVLLTILSSCNTSKSWKTDLLEITPLTQNTFVHKSFLQTDDYGKVSCNGLIYVNGHEAMIFDSPTTDSASSELIQWIETALGAKIVSIIVTHSHDDCLGGLSTFHKKGIPSYANELTQKLAKESGYTIPQNTFIGQLTSKVGKAQVQSIFPGEGHTLDNIVSFIPDENVLFGGCLIKAINASEGYIAEGNVAKWSNSVENIKRHFTDIKYVVPGHGSPGDTSLLDYTIELFDKNR